MVRPNDPINIAGYGNEKSSTSELLYGGLLQSHKVRIDTANRHPLIPSIVRQLLRPLPEETSAPTRTAGERVEGSHPLLEIQVLAHDELSRPSSARNLVKVMEHDHQIHDESTS